MGNDFRSIAFTPAVQAVQEAEGSRKIYAMQDTLDNRRGRHDLIGEDEAEFIEARDSFYMASVGETGWPYIQHRGGPPGFLSVLDERTLGFADFAGNRQYISVGNVSGDGRVCLFLMDYAERTRLKILGHAHVTQDAATIERVTSKSNSAKIERAWTIEVAGFDWNCSKYITPRFTDVAVRRVVEPLQERIRELEAEVQRLKTP